MEEIKVSVDMFKFFQLIEKVSELPLDQREKVFVYIQGFLAGNSTNQNSKPIA